MFNKKMIISLWLICLILASIVVAAPRLSSPDNPVVRYINQSIDNKIDVTLELSSGAAAASLAVSALPGDTATPISEKLAEFGSGFLLVLCVLYFEKSMFSVIVFVLFFLGIPLAIVFILVYQKWSDPRYLRLAAFVLIVDLLLWMVVPVSQFLSDLVYVNQQSIVQDTIQSSEDLTLEIAEGKEETVESGEGETEDGNLVQKLYTTVSSMSGKMVNKAKHMITGFLQSLALMIVTACVIPIVILLAFLWLIKISFHYFFSMDAQVFRMMKRAEQ